MGKKPQKRHDDGTICREGTALLPRPFKPCCDIFRNQTTACAYDIRYEWWARKRMWVTALPKSAGGGGMQISFCPHCGTRLAGRLTTLEHLNGERNG